MFSLISTIRKNQVGSDQENLEARPLDPSGPSMRLENCCSTNYALGMKNGERDHHAETSCPHEC
jgi:hypothetical protein